MLPNDMLKQTLLNDCSFYIEKLRECNQGSILVRGYFGHIQTAKKFNHNLEFRKPLHTPEYVHNLINSTFQEAFGWKIRNGVFCFGFNIKSKELPKELGYGPFFMCFPVGIFKLVYSPTVMDMYGHMTLSASPIEKILPDMDFIDGDLCNAIASGDRKHQNVSNEISVCTKSYYLLNYDLKDFVETLIWR